MKNTSNVFYQIPCLTDEVRLLSGLAIRKKWFKSADKRIIGQYLQKFIHYNKNSFDFLGVHPHLIGSDKDISIGFQSSEFVGAIPLRAPDTGKQIGDFIVVPRFAGRNKFEAYVEIIKALKTEIEPEIIDSLPLASGNFFNPPKYLEAIKFISTLERLIDASWVKFKTTERIINKPDGQVKWNKYFNNLYKVENTSRFSVRKNHLTELHSEFSEIRFVFDLCKRELLSPTTPIRVKHSTKNKLQILEKKLHHHKPKVTKHIFVRHSDSPNIQQIKNQANQFLNNTSKSTAWRVDFSNVFENFVQHIFKKVAAEKGAHIFSNYRITSETSKSFAWELKYLEPDIIYQKANFIAFIDAKYKSHLYNKFHKNEKLKEDYRHDLHQILAYSSFGNKKIESGLLCFPSNKIEVKERLYLNNINGSGTIVYIVGIPLNKNAIHEVKELISKLFDTLL